MADEHVPTREVVHLEPPSDPLIAFFWARLDEREAEYREGVRLYDFDGNGDEAWIEAESKHGLADVAAKKAILDDYAAACRTRNQDAGVYASDYLAADGEARVLRDVIKRLATVYDGHPDYDPAWRP